MSLSLSPRQAREAERVLRLFGTRCIWPSPYDVDSLESVVAFVLKCWTWNEAAKEFQQIPDRKYIRAYIAKWYANRNRKGLMFTEKCRRMLISWVSRACELWDLGLQRSDKLLVGEDLEAAAKQMWRYDCLYSQLSLKNPGWQLEKLETHKYAGEKQLKSVQLPNGSRVAYANGQSAGIQGDGYSEVVLEEPTLYPYLGDILAQAMIVTQGTSGSRGGSVHCIGNAKAGNDSWQSIKREWLKQEAETVMPGFTVRTTLSDEWFLELDWWADDTRDDAWLERTRIEMLSTPFQFREQILRQDQQAQGALWDYDIIESTRRKELPQLVCIAVAIDPSVSDPALKKNPSKEMDECGILVGGVDGDGQGYVLKDLSGRFKPIDWARIACSALQKFAGAVNAPRWVLVAEKNQGGELVREVLKSVWQDAPVVLVNASIKKRARAEPVAALYFQDRIHHIGVFRELEREMVSWSGQNPSQPSPGRIDALAWLFHGLGLCGDMEIRTMDRLGTEAKDEEDPYLD